MSDTKSGDDNTLSVTPKKTLTLRLHERRRLNEARLGPLDAPST